MLSFSSSRFLKVAAPTAGAAASSCMTSYMFQQNISSGCSRNFVSSSTKALSNRLAKSVLAKKNHEVTHTVRHFSNNDAASKSPSFLKWYESHLSANPIPTKMVTGSFLWGVGDFVAQVVPGLFYGDDENVKESSSDKQPMSAYDYARTGRAVFFGFALHAPLSHVHFNFLETLTVRSGITGLGIPVFKAFMEQFVYWSWISNSLYHGAMGAMQGMNATQIYDRIADVLWETQKAQWVFWIPVQLLNFRFVPVRHQLNVVLITSIVWTALLSAWYPPTDEEKKKEIKNQ